MKIFTFLAILLVFGNSFCQKQLYINEVLSSSSGSNKLESSDWVELYNPNNTDISLKGWYLSDNPKHPQKWKFPNITIKANSFFIIYLSGIKSRSKRIVHANFKLSANGEALILSNSKGLIVDCIIANPCSKGISYGRSTDGSPNFERFITPSKNSSNNESKGILFSSESGFYDHFFELILTAKQGDSIRYTKDGSIPNRYSKAYHSAININSRQDELDVLTQLSSNRSGNSTAKKFKGCVIRAATFENGFRTSKVYTKTFFTYPNIASKHKGFNVVSLVTDINNLFHKDSGLYIGNGTGTNANYNKRGLNWQRQANITLFDTSGAIDFAEDVDIRIHGQTTRKYPSKSFRIYANSDYSTPIIQTTVFKQSDNTNHDKLVLKASMGDLQKTAFKDELTTYICRDLNADILDYAHCILYINGEYWGIYNLREFLGKNYISEKYNINRGSIQIIEHSNFSKYALSSSSTKNTKTMLQMFYKYAQSLPDSISYNIISKCFNTKSLIDYYCANLFFGNTDYLENNNKLWHTGMNGRWHQFLFDLDYGWMDSEMDNISPLINPNTSQRHPSHATLLFRTLISNQFFKKKFLSRMAYLLQNDFSSTKLQEAITLFKHNYKPHMRMHTSRWSRPGSVSQWERKVSNLEGFAKTRHAYFRRYLKVLE